MKVSVYGAPVGPPQKTKRQGIVYTFYSFKGGVGRSMALANVAALLAKSGHRCLVVDWDLEAPGIEKYFQQFPSRIEGSPLEMPGLLDMLEGLKEGRRLDWRKCLLTARPFRAGSPVHILTAGRRSKTYNEAVQSLDWEVLFEKYDLGAYLDQVREEWILEFDFVLVDSRTGINDIGSICTVLLPDVIVLFFTTNRQSLEGVIEITHAARQARSALPVDRARLIAVPVPARDESQGAEYERAQEWKGIFASELEDLYRDWIPRHLTPRDILNKLYIPYITIWSFGERLPVVERQEEISDPRSVSAAYSRLATLLAHRLDWSSLEQGEGYAEAAHAREEIARTKEEGNRKIRSAWIYSVVVSLIISVLGSITAFMVYSRASRDEEAKKILAVAAAVEDPLTKTLLAAEAGGLEGDSAALLTLRELAAVGPVPVAAFRNDSWKVTAATFGREGEVVATATSDGALRIWDSPGRKSPVRMAVEGSPTVRRVEFSNDADFLLALTDLQNALVFHWPASPRSVLEVEGVADARFLTSPKEGLLVVRTFGGIEILSVNGSTKRFFPGLRREGAGRVTFSDDATTVAFLGEGLDSLGAGIEVWRVDASGENVDFGSQVIPLRDPGLVTAGALSPMGNLIALGFADGRVSIWTLGEPPRIYEEIQAYGERVEQIIFSRDGRGILAASSNDAKFWPLIGKGAGTKLPGQAGQITCLAFSPEDDRFLVASRDGTASVWSEHSEGSPLVLRGHEGGVISAEFSQDGSRVLTVSGSGTARVWSLRKDPPPPKSWDGLSRFLKERTSACLLPSQRIQYLSESRTEAQKAFDNCERRKRAMGQISTQ